MTTVRKFLALIIAGMLIGPIAAHATLLTIEPDDFAAGTNLTSAFDGISITSVSLSVTGIRDDGLPIYSPVLGAVYSHLVPTGAGSGAFVYGAATGDRVFGSTSDSDANVSGIRWGQLFGSTCLLTSCSAPGLAQDIGQVLRLDFDIPTNFVSAIGRFTGGDPTVIYAYDEFGQLVDHCAELSLDFQGNVCASRFYTAEPVFSTLYGWGDVKVSSDTRNIKTVLIGGAISSQFVDQIVVNAPEPSTLALYGFGLLGLVMSRRRTPKIRR